MALSSAVVGIASNARPIGSETFVRERPLLLARLLPRFKCGYPPSWRGLVRSVCSFQSAQAAESREAASNAFTRGFMLVARSNGPHKCQRLAEGAVKYRMLVVVRGVFICHDTIHTL